MDNYVSKVSDAVTAYQEKANELIDVIDKLEGELASLKTCEYSLPVIGSHLQNMQKNVDQLSLGGFASLNTWVEELDKRVRMFLLFYFSII